MFVGVVAGWDGLKQKKLKKLLDAHLDHAYKPALPVGSTETRSGDDDKRKEESDREMGDESTRFIQTSSV